MERPPTENKWLAKRVNDNQSENEWQEFRIGWLDLVAHRCALQRWRRFSCNMPRSTKWIEKLRFVSAKYLGTNKDVGRYFETEMTLMVI